MNNKRAVVVAFLAGCTLVLSQYTLPAVLAAAQNDAAAKAPTDAGKDSVSVSQLPVNATRAAREEKALQDARRQQLAEKEAALAAKEQELKKTERKARSAGKSAR